MRGSSLKGAITSFEYAFVSFDVIAQPFEAALRLEGKGERGETLGGSSPYPVDIRDRELDLGFIENYLHMEPI